MSNADGEEGGSVLAYDGLRVQLHSVRAGTESEPGVRAWTLG